MVIDKIVDGFTKIVTITKSKVKIKTKLKLFFLFFFCIYKIYLISAEGYTNAGVHFLKIRKTDEISASMKDCGEGVGVKIVPDLYSKETYSIYGKKNNKKRN